MKRIITILIAVLAFASCEKQTSEIRITKEILAYECPPCEVTAIAQVPATAIMASNLYYLAGVDAPGKAFDLEKDDKDEVVGVMVEANVTRLGEPFGMLALYIDGEKKAHYLYRITK